MTITAHASMSALLYGLTLRALWWAVCLFFPWLVLFEPEAVNLWLILCTLGAVEGALPDVIGWAGRVVYRWFGGKRWMVSKWDWYHSAHTGRIAYFFRRFPGYQLHVRKVDPLCHKPEGGWYWWVIPVEVGYWLILITLWLL